jgi:hypothetical protein
MIHEHSLTLLSAQWLTLITVILTTKLQGDSSNAANLCKPFRDTFCASVKIQEMIKAGMTHQKELSDSERMSSYM